MDLTEEIFQSCNNVVIEEASNVIDEKSNHTLQYEQKHNVVLPSEEKKIAINVSAIRKIRSECACAKKNKFTYAELWLGLCTLFLGAFFSALISQIPYEVSFLSILFYSICPVFGGIFGVAYFFCRKNSNKDIVQLAEKIEDYIIDPEDMEETKNEH